MPKRLIVTGDDFGLAVPVNEAVELGHRDGILTSASLMVTAPAAADAIERARHMPRLAVGLHLVLVGGRPALPPEQIPDLVGADGRFPSNPVGLGTRIYLRRQAQAQVEAEIRAQLRAYLTTGLRLDHVDGHQHFHLHPTVQEILVRIAPEFGIAAIRVPDEPALVRGAGRSLRQWFAASALRGRIPAMKKRLSRAHIRFNDAIMGIADSGHMDAARIRAMLASLPDGITEIYVHPATRRWAGADALPESYQPEVELAALLDPSVRAAVAASGATLSAFGDLADASPPATPGATVAGLSDLPA